MLHPLQIGRVPTPHAGDEDKYLKGDGTWAEAGSSNVEANPSGTPTDTLETIGIDNVIYQLPEGGDTEITGDEEGSIIAIDDGKLNAPLKACTVDINPVQSGSGTPSPSNIRPISGWTEANITVAGTNIWDEEWEAGRISVTTGENSNGNGIRSKNLISVKPSTGYRALRGTYSDASSIVIYYYDALSNYISYEGKFGSNVTFTTPSNAAYIRFNIQTSQAVTYNNDISINYPSTDTLYHAYTGTTYNIEFEDSGSPLTVYGGTLDTVSGVLTVDRAFVELDGSSDEIWMMGSASGHDRAYIKIDDIESYTGAYSSISQLYVCSIFDNGSWNSVFSGEPKAGMTGQNWGFGLDSFSITTDTELREWLSTNNIQIAYKLATPITIQLTPAQIITTLYGKNVIWADSGDIAITYVRDTSIAINDALNQSITPTYSSGTKIADYNVGGQTGAIYVQGAGGHMDTLWTGNETPTMSYNPTITLTHPISDYDLILVNFNIHNGAGTYLKATLPLYGATVGDNFAQEFLTTNGAIMFVNILNNYNITLNCYGGSYENTTYVSIIGVKL